MISIRKAAERGRNQFSWLDSWHSFSFGGYYDPAHMGFGPLRVINEDIAKGGGGFPTHPHDNMEIVTYILNGALEHKDSMGNGSVIRRGDIQRMSAGTGVTHSEFNESATEPCHLLQIWFLPEKKDIKPGYEQKTFTEADKKGRLKLVASRGGREGSVSVNQDVDMYAGLLGNGEVIVHAFDNGRLGWLQVAKGSVNINGQPLSVGDGAAIRDEAEIVFDDANGAEIILFDMSA